MSDLIETGTDAIFQLGLRLTKAEAEQVFQAALSAIEKSGTHKVVPAEPTESMKHAIWFEMSCIHPDQGELSKGGEARLYYAMLSARPPLPEGEKT